MADRQLPTGFTFVTQSEGIEEYRLRNGMKLLLVENRVAPVVTVLVVYKVGSRNEAVGHTGATHLLEHMMFKGTPTFNKANNTQIAASLARIGADFNATTWYDRTNYYETVPSDQIEFAIKLEADRMRNSLILDEDRQSEMTVVRNELERGQNEPSDVLDEAVYATAFREHPYHHPTIGWRSDVEGVATSRLKEFFHTFYHPNNATVAIVGDFDRSNALELVGKYFGDHDATPHQIPEVYTNEPPQEGERRIVIRRAGELAIVEVAFRTPAALGQSNVLSNSELAERAKNPPDQNDTYPLAVLSTALTHGVTSRLYQALVETELAVDVSSNADQHRDPGLFTITVTAGPGIEPKKVEDVILAELDLFAREGLTDAETDKAKQQILAHEAFGRDGTFRIAAQISEAEAVADWRYFRDYPKKIAAVTANDVQRAVQTYFLEDNRTVGYFIPKEKGATATSGNGHRRLHPRGLQFLSEPALAGRDDGGFASRVSRTRAESGATLLTLANRATPTVSLRGSLRAGSYFALVEKRGIADITAEMLARGTKCRSKLEIATALESVGAEIEFSSDQFAVNVGARFLARDLSMVVSTLAEQLREPAFPPNELEKLKQQTIANIREHQTRTSHRAYERFTQLVFKPGNPFYLPTGEELIDDIASLAVDDIGAFHERQFGGRSLILALAGDIDRDELEQQFGELFGSFGGPASVEIDVNDPIPQPAAVREIVVVKDKANVDIVMGSAVRLRRNSPDYYAAILGNNALGLSTLSSKLGLRVRDEEGLTYGINSRFRSASLAAGPWTIGVSVNPQNIEQAINSSLDVVREFDEVGITDEELANEKSYATGSFKVSLATNGGLARAMWNAEYFDLGEDFVDRYPAIIDAITRDEVNAAIRTHFHPDQLTTVISGDLVG